MSRAISPSSGKPYRLALVCRAYSASRHLNTWLGPSCYELVTSGNPRK